MRAACSAKRGPRRIARENASAPQRAARENIQLSRPRERGRGWGRPAVKRKRRSFRPSETRLPAASWSEHCRSSFESRTPNHVATYRIARRGSSQETGPPGPQAGDWLIFRTVEMSPDVSSLGSSRVLYAVPSPSSRLSSSYCPLLSRRHSSRNCRSWAGLAVRSMSLPRGYFFSNSD